MGFDDGLKDVAARILFEKEGAWIISKEVAESVDGLNVLAYVFHAAVTPNQVGGNIPWVVRVAPPNQRSASQPRATAEFRPDPSVKLRMEEWNRADAGLDKFDGLEEDDGEYIEHAGSPSASRENTGEPLSTLGTPTGSGAPMVQQEAVLPTPAGAAAPSAASTEPATTAPADIARAVEQK